MKYCSILPPPRPNLEKGAGTRLPAAFSRKLGPVLERQLASSKLRSRGLLEAILEDSGRLKNDVGSKMSSKSIKMGSKMAPKRVSDRVFDSELVFQSIFIDF